MSSEEAVRTHYDEVGMQEQKIIIKNKHDRGRTFARLSPPQNHHETHTAKQKLRRTTGTLRHLHTHRVWIQAHARQQTERLGDGGEGDGNITVWAVGNKSVNVEKQKSGVYLKTLKKCRINPINERGVGNTNLWQRKCARWVDEGRTWREFSGRGWLNLGVRGQWSVWEPEIQVRNLGEEGRERGGRRWEGFCIVLRFMKTDT